MRLWLGACDHCVLLFEGTVPSWSRTLPGGSSLVSPKLVVVNFGWPISGIGQR
jgi:hypothetical protein